MKGQMNMLTNQDISIVKGMLLRGDKQHDIAAHFGCNSGRIAEVALGKVGPNVPAASVARLPAASAQPKRFFAPGMPLEEQIAIFNALANGPFDVARAHYISPELAEHILQHNTQNRPKRTGNIARWAANMADGEWGLTGETIVFSKSPVRLLDGQHRLAACVKAGVGFRTFVAFGIDRGEFTKINTGAVKTNGDALAILGVSDPSCVAAALRWRHLLLSNPHDRSSLTNEFIVQQWKALDKSPLGVQLKEFCVQARGIVKATKKNGSSVFTPGQLAGILLRLHVVDEKATAKFIQSLETQKGNGKVLTTRLEKISEFGRINDVGRAGMIVKAWLATRDGTAISAKGVVYDPSTDAFPHVG
ncbi:MAG: hypothetical protein RI928_1683 [Pseudomonadota bacterium]|jgi:hypothetical protein